MLEKIQSCSRIIRIYSEIILLFVILWICIGVSQKNEKIFEKCLNDRMDEYFLQW